MFSNTPMTVESAAQLMKTKKSVPQRMPPSMALKMLGRVMKIRPGPLSGATLKAKQAGKMIRPAMMATKVSRLMIHRASPVRERSLLW